MAPLTLYHFAPSAHSRGALLTIRNLDLEVDIKSLNLFSKEQLNPDFIKLNPQHVVPTLKDGDFVMWESRAIATYLVDTKSPNSSLYPTDIKQRAIIDQTLYFDAGTFYPSIRAICYAALFLGEKKISEDKRKRLNETMGWLEGFLTNNKYVAGDNLTVADIFLLCSLSSILHVGFDLKSYPHIRAWYETCKSIPGFEEMEQGAQEFGNKVKSLLEDKL